MNNKILKTSAVLALGTLLLVPNGKEVYAANTSTEANESVKTAEEEFKNLLEEANNEIAKAFKYTETYNYKNANAEYQLTFNTKLNDLNTSYNDYKDRNLDSELDYDTWSKVLSLRISELKQAKENLNGREVDRSELLSLAAEQDSFHKEDAYKNASKELKNNYDNAIRKTYKLLYDSERNLTNLENEEAIKAIKEAKNKILSQEEVRKARLALKEELGFINDIKAAKASYTQKSYNNYNNAAILAKSTYENPNSSLDKIKSSTDLLANARENLVKIQTAEDIKRKDQIERLEKAIKANKDIKAAANLLKKITPNIASKNIETLNSLIKKSDQIIIKSTKVLNQLKGIKG